MGGLSGGNRTPDPQLRRLLLYPSELLALRTLLRRSLPLHPRDPIGAAGFEPATSCSQSRRDTGLRYAPPTPKHSQPWRDGQPVRGAVLSTASNSAAKARAR